MSLACEAQCLKRELEPQELDKQGEAEQGNPDSQAENVGVYFWDN